MAAESSVYLSSDSLQEIYELLEGGFLDDDVDFKKELDASILQKKLMIKSKFLKVLCVGKSVFLLQG